MDQPLHATLSVSVHEAIFGRDSVRASAAADEAASQHLVEIETLALHRWCKGDPSGFLELSADDVSYFDPFLRQRLDGLPALRTYYEGLRGKVSVERLELRNPLVHRLDNATVLTYNFVSCGANREAMRWNCTEVYRFAQGAWKIVQTHWSFTASQ